MGQKKFNSVKEIRLLKGLGPWDTKSGAQLYVLFSIPLSDLNNRFFVYDQEELDSIGADIRGLRSYVVEGIPEGRIGANEWHRVRHEIVICRKGKIVWEFEDLEGEKLEMSLEPGTSAWIPPFVLHAYKALEKDSMIQVIANTLFIPDDPTTHDSYSAESFEQLKSTF
jgi:dTDP-4-dehydrorhamnose 3,5-epimerase-like enzyme